jgi:hypothetical protein
MEWKAADKKACTAHFSPVIIRTALDKRDGYPAAAQKDLRPNLEYASHASYPGMWLEELAKRLVAR